jgi:Zn-dependent protease
VSRLELFLYLVPLLVGSMVLHELAHALVATRLGDPTPREHGRLTLNPVSHLDPLGTAMFGITFWLSSFMFGWAKPVIVAPGHFRRPKEGMALVAVAGPVTNFLIALGCAAVLVHVDVSDRTFEVLALLYQVNVILGVFNLLPPFRRWTARGSWPLRCRARRTSAGARSTNTGCSRSSG